MVSIGIWAAAMFVDILTARFVGTNAICTSADRASLFRLAALCTVPFTCLGLVRVWVHVADTFGAAIVRVRRLDLVLLSMVAVGLVVGLVGALLLVGQVELRPCRA